MTVNVRVPSKFLVNDLPTETWIEVRIDPVLLEKRAELAHWDFRGENGKLGTIVLPSERVDFSILMHEAHHAAVDIANGHVPVDGLTEVEAEDLRHEAGAIIVERLAEQVIRFNKL